MKVKVPTSTIPISKLYLIKLLLWNYAQGKGELYRDDQWSREKHGRRRKLLMGNLRRLVSKSKFGALQDASLNRLDVCGESLFHSAIRTDEVEVFRFFAKRLDASLVNVPCNDGNTPLHLCARLQAGGLEYHSVSTPDDYLCDTTFFCNDMITELLAFNNIRVDALDAKGNTPLHTVAESGK